MARRIRGGNEMEGDRLQPVISSLSVLHRLLGWTGWISLQFKGVFKSVLQHHSSKASILRHSASFIVQLSHPYMITGKTIALTRWTFVGKIMSLLFNKLSRLVIVFLPRSKHLLISWLCHLMQRGDSLEKTLMLGLFFFPGEMENCC